MKILFLVPYPTEGASNRIRVEQFVPYLTEAGYRCRIRPFATKRFFRILYDDRRYVEKAFWFLICTLNRMCDLVRALRYDLVFIHREAYPFGGPFFERILSFMKKKIVFDFDDAIFLPNTSRTNIYIERFKSPGKTAEIIGMSRHVIAGNGYLANFASRFNKDVVVIPSSADTDAYCPRPRTGTREGVVIGWVGSKTTVNFLNDMEDVFREISARFRNVTFKFIGARYSREGLNVINVPWSLEGEASEIRDLDIGIMPMPDNDWTRGKCGFKIILYMACGLAIVSSPVGVNKEIIKDGKNGALAASKDEWVKKLSALIEDGDLRRRLGKEGRRTVEEYYSVKRNAPQFIKVINDTIAS
jgi:glycosyltransferase involved in cell wall biosynthesis